jgi:hypothetical protein
MFRWINRGRHPSSLVAVFVLILASTATAVTAQQPPIRQPSVPMPVTTPERPNPAQIEATRRPIQIVPTPQRSTVASIADQTRGQRITIAGKAIQLPADAYVRAEVVDALCAPELAAQAGKACPEVPAYDIVRGKSRIVVGVKTGRVNWREFAPGEERCFDFLNGMLP